MQFVIAREQHSRSHVILVLHVSSFTAVHHTLSVVLGLEINRILSHFPLKTSQYAVRRYNEEHAGFLSNILSCHHFQVG
jgi:hypothetical protein